MCLLLPLSSFFWYLLPKRGENPKFLVILFVVLLVMYFFFIIVFVLATVVACILLSLYEIKLLGYYSM
jgi:hypothetical protein